MPSLLLRPAFGPIAPWPARNVTVAIGYHALTTTTCLDVQTITWVTRTALASLGQSAMARDGFPWEYTYPPRDVLLWSAAPIPFGP